MYQSTRGLIRDYTGCNRCSLCSPHRTQVVMGFGHPNADIMIIGEAPGEAEDGRGFPFVGPSGRALNSMLANCNLTRDEVWTTNVVLCRPAIRDRNDRLENRTPTNPEIEACRERLIQEIALIDPNVIILMGDVAIRALTRERKKMEALAGKTSKIEIEVDGYPAEYLGFMCWHPSYLLRVDAARDPNGPFYQMTDFLRFAVRTSDFINLMRDDPEAALSKEPPLPDRGMNLSQLGSL
ncbi:MAG: uracil-DNA glycosylase [Planctomycetes bacterium]|nr:uracil-DNA glycosylase [Planctomycetota bacterium]